MQELITTFPSSVVNIIFLEIVFFHQLILRPFFPSETFIAFKKSILKFIRSSSNSTFNCHSPSGIKLITTIRLGLSRPRNHEFRHNSQDILNSICSCGDDIENSIYYLLHCQNYLDERMTLFDNFQSV